LEEKDGLTMYYQPATCNHCMSPACVLACPTGAMQKRDDDIVISDPEVCIGCQTCAIACPFGIPQLHTGAGKITKCNNCSERVMKGLSPACVLACPTGALSYLDQSMQNWRTREQAAGMLRRIGLRK
jgi:anaerobic dimethyl sulfoxide reductase subunit B (iron-sulfur subunit)